LQVVAVLSLTALPASSAADVITGAIPESTTPTVTATDTTAATTDPNAVSFTTVGLAPLFDATGTTLLYTSPSRFLDFSGPRPKLLSYGGGAESGSGGYSNGSLLPDGVVAGLNSGVSSGEMANMTLTATDQTGAPTSFSSFGSSTMKVPESSTLLLFACGLVLGARRLATRFRPGNSLSELEPARSTDRSEADIR
jgi:hypothetical protein